MSDGETSNSEERLPLDTDAPLIDTVDVFNNKINLTEILKENNGIIIDFHRAAWWYYWKVQLEKLNKNIDEIKKRNVKLITIMTDRAMAIKKLAEKQNYDFTIISDEKAEISKQYKAFGKPVDFDMIKMLIAIPTTYLIDTNGKIVWRYLGNKTERPTIEAILEAIDTKL